MDRPLLAAQQAIKAVFRNSEEWLISRMLDTGKIVEELRLVALPLHQTAEHRRMFIRIIEQRAFL